MSCSINIIRRSKPVREVKYVPDPEMEKIMYDISVEECLLDIYEKIGYIKERLERLENDNGKL
jgi:hypothetical protein